MTDRGETSTGIGFGGTHSNITLQQNPANLDTTAAVASVLECMTLQQSTLHIPVFDGRNPPLKEFLQDVANGAAFLTENSEPGFINAVLSKLKGAARECVRDRRFQRLDELVSHLKKRFASFKKYQWYLDGIMSIRFKQTETVSDYNDRLQGLLSGARHALQAKYNARYREVQGDAVRIQETPESTIMMKPIIDCALEAFIRGLPEEMSIFVDTRNPANLEEAFEHALRAEERHKYSDRSRGTSYHITRAEERPRSPSPYTRQVERNVPNPDKRRSESDRDSESHRSRKNPYDTTTCSVSWTSRKFKLPTDSAHRRGGESNPAASAECPVRGQYHKVLRAGNTAEDSPVVQFTASEFREPKIRFLVDPGSDTNLIKLCALEPELTLDPSKRTEITGITNHTVRTLGTIVLNIANTPVEFHVVRNNFPVSTHGILGRPYLRQEKAQLSFWHNTLVTISNPVTPIPFVDKESLAAKQILKPLIKPFKRVLRIRARTRHPIAIDVRNPNLPQGYLPRINTPPGVYLGDAVVNSENGVCHAVAINTTEEDVDLELTPQELIPFDFCNLEDKESSDSEFDHPSPPLLTYAERIKKVKDALFVSHLNSEEKELVFQWADDYADIFHLNGEPLSCTHLIQHRIPTTDDKIIHKKQYRSPNEALQQIDEQLLKQFDSGIIGNSTSPYNSPLLIVPKKLDASGKRKWRVVIDYRALNEKVIGDAYPLPNISAIFDKLGTATYFTVFDLASGFHQVETHPDDRHKTAFSSRNGHFEYKRMPMGIKNAPPTFQRLLNNVLGGMLDSEAFVYLDDIIIYSDTLEEHDRRARRLYNRLREANLKLQPDKCEFLKKEVAYLGHIVGADGVKPNPVKIKAIKHFPVPKTPKEVRSFLGLSGYYRRFIKEYAKAAKPLSDLLKKTEEWNWGIPQQKSFKRLRKALCKRPILQYPDFTKPFKLTTDASEYAIGAMLTQERDGIDLPVAYYSKVLNATEQKYLKPEKECLAILYAVEHFRPYLYDQDFILSCDCEPVHWMSYVENPGTRLQKWRLKLRGYRYKFEYKPGKINRIVEALSNNPVENNDKENINEELLSSESEWTESSDESDQDDLHDKLDESKDNTPPLRALPISSSALKKTSGDSARVKSDQLQSDSKNRQGAPHPSRVEPKPTNKQEGKNIRPIPTFKFPAETRKGVSSSRSVIPPSGSRQAPPTSSSTSRTTRSSGDSLRPATSKETPFMPRKILTRPPTSQSIKPVCSSGNSSPIPGTSSEPKPTTSRPRGRPHGSTKPKEPQGEDAYVPPPGSKLVDPDVSSIARRLRERKREIREETRRQEEESSSSNESTTETDKEEISDPPVFRASHSVFPSLPPHLTPKSSTTPETQININQSSPPCIPPESSSYTDVYVDGACCDNGGVRPRAGIGVWFGPDHPLNISQRYKGRQTNNASEIEAATAAIKQAKRAGMNHLRIKTDSKVLVQAIQEWVPKWQKNDWKTNENKPVKNKSAYERLVKAMKNLDVVWEHVPGHDGIDGNENADRLAREGALLEPPSESSSSSSSESSDQESAEVLPPDQAIVTVPPPPPDSEESSESEDEQEKETKTQDNPTDPSDQDDSLQRSIKRFDESLKQRDLNSFEQSNQTLAWDHEGMGRTPKKRIHVSDGESDEDYLQYLESLDPCGEGDDGEFATRVKRFLDNFNKKRESNREQDHTPRVESIPPLVCEPPSTSGILKDTPVTSHPCPGRKQSVVRFQDMPEVIEEASVNDSIAASLPAFTPGNLPAPGAQSTPFTRFQEKESEEQTEEVRRRANIVPRRLHSNCADLPPPVMCIPRAASPIDISISDVDSPSSSESSDDEKVIATTSKITKENSENVFHQWTEPLTYKKDNIAHFISEDCEPVDSISKLLIATNKIDLQDIRDNNPIKGQVQVTLCGRYKIYSIVVKKRHSDELNWSDVTVGLRNLKYALVLDNQTHCRMANSGDLLGNLPQTTMAGILAGIFRGGDIKITLCHGKIEVPPPEIRPKIISEFHDSLVGGHKGITKTYRRIRERYYWPRLRDDVTQFIRKCKSCLENKLVRARTREPMLITDTPANPFDKVSLDTVGKLRTTPNGNRHILTMQDNFSKYCIAVPIPDIKTTTIAHAVATNLFSLYGAPRCVLTDRGGSFVSSLMRKLEKIFGVKQLTTSGYRPQTNGALERSHIELTDYIKHYANDFDDWDRLLPFAMFNYNTSVHEATNFTPYELVFGRMARIPSSFPQGPELETYGVYLRDLIVRMHELQNLAADRLIRAKERSKEFHDSKARPSNVKVGDQVYTYKEVRTNKFDSRALGPYTVVGLTQNNNVILEDENGERFAKHKDKIMVAHF
ncbi:uncharacterized protein LOC127281712 [Leptopilina boulardi]|uniref:uncharacterized protein LOC127281712 n=1 Tax=Leptopilina boulardi TaxID=63433 RepID=UPI0021F60AFE|nr:uncharacterized protein LOC127281712 [Leptopilina boulardi]